VFLLLVLMVFLLLLGVALVVPRLTILFVIRQVQVWSFKGSTPLVSL
jgi:hypothetical protein